MKNSKIFIVALFSSVLAVANADEQSDNEKVIDDAIALCDAKYNDEDYNDEKERNQLYEECVDNMINQAALKTTPKAKES